MASSNTYFGACLLAINSPKQPLTLVPYSSLSDS